MRSDEDFRECLARHLEGHRFDVGATLDMETLRGLWELSRELPDNFSLMMRTVRRLRAYSVHDVALAFTVGLLRDDVDAIAADPPSEIFDLKGVALPNDIYARVARRNARHPKLRARAAELARRHRIEDVALPLREGERWDHTGWTRGAEPNQLYAHSTGARRQEEVGVPPIADIAELRELLGIRTPAQLGFYLLASDTSNLKPYRTFTIPKRRGGERTIAAPCDDLRHTQQAILKEILSKLPTHDAAHGFVPGRSTVTNATPHVGKKLLIKFDLADFFPTIRYWRVVGLFASMGYTVGRLCFSTQDDDLEVATTLARLCCYTELPQRTTSAYTPQGAPTSPAISNLICRHLDKRLANLAASMGGDYTRYADDLTFSFDEEPSRGVGRFRWWINQICQQEGFVVREDKFRVIRSSQQQRVTGVVVNDGLSIPRKERRRFRAIVHNCERDGLASQARGRPDFESYLMGYAAYMNMVSPDEGGELLARVKKLVGGG